MTPLHNSPRAAGRRLAVIGWALAAATILAGPVPAAEPVRLEVSDAEVGRYERVDFSLDAPTGYDNPFDPGEVDLRVELETPGGARLSIPAFFYQDYERRTVPRSGRPAAWLYPVGEPVWRARFAPRQVGVYRAAAVLTDARGTRRCAAVTFRCVPSSGKGFLRTSKSDPRFLEFSDGTPFFPIGQNLAFIGETQYVDLLRAEEIFGKLARSGANYLRIWTCAEDWALAIEARKSAWGRSWHWKPPLVPVADGHETPNGPDAEPRPLCVRLAAGEGASVSVSPSHPVAIRPETQYVFSGQVRVEGDAEVQVGIGRLAEAALAKGAAPGRWTGWRLDFQCPAGQFWLPSVQLRLEGKGQAWLRDLSLRDAGGGPELLWEADPNRPMPGTYNPVDCFMLDRIVELAERHGIYLQLCLIARDLYMDSLADPESAEYGRAIDHAKRLLRYAVARWGYSANVGAWEYFNEMNPGLPTDRFYAELGRYLEEIDVYGHLRTTSAWGPAPKDWRHPQLDVAEAHFYLRPSDAGRLDNEVEAVLDRAALLRRHAPDKPAKLGEFGLADEKWRPDPETAKHPELVDFHNALWASALSGTSGTALYWWWDRLDRRDAYRHYRPLADFLSDVPWTTGRLRPVSAMVAEDRVRLVGLQGPDRAYLWLFNPEASWANSVVRGAEPSEIRSATVVLEGLAHGVYRVTYRDPWTGKTLGDSSRPSRDGELGLTLPDFSRDVACKVVPGGQRVPGRN